MSDNKETFTTGQKVATALFWLAILFIPFWYWSSADGVRTIKNMHVHEIFHDDVLAAMNAKTAAQTMSKTMLANMGYDVDTTFQKALQATNPQSVDFEVSKAKLPDFRGKTVKSVAVLLKYNPPLDGRYKAIAIVFGVQKDWFFHFNPVPVAPATVTYIDTYDRARVDSLGSNADNLQIAEPVLKYFKK